MVIVRFISHRRQPCGSWETSLVCPLLAPEYPIIHPAYMVQVAGFKLKAKDGLGPGATSDPFFTVRVSRAERKSEPPILLYRSEVSKLTFPV